MNAESPPSRRFRFLHWFLIVTAAAMLVITIKVVGIFFLSAEARDLQAAITQSTDWRTDPQIQFSIGPGILSIGRMAALCIDDIPFEARQALGAVKGASVGIYHLDRGAAAADPARLMAAADQRLKTKGWDRIVSVADGRDLVLVYMPRDWDESEDLEVCIAVCDGNELVVVSATARAQPLIELAQRHLPEHGMIPARIPADA